LSDEITINSDVTIGYPAPWGKKYFWVNFLHIFGRYQQKLQSLKRKMGAKARKKQKVAICYFVIFRSNKIPRFNTRNALAKAISLGWNINTEAAAGGQ